MIVEPPVTVAAVCVEIADESPQFIWYKAPDGTVNVAVTKSGVVLFGVSEVML